MAQIGRTTTQTGTTTIQTGGTMTQTGRIMAQTGTIHIGETPPMTLTITPQGFLSRLPTLQFLPTS